MVYTYPHSQQLWLGFSVRTTECNAMQRSFINSTLLSVSPPAWLAHDRLLDISDVAHTCESPSWQKRGRKKKENVVDYCTWPSSPSSLHIALLAWWYSVHLVYCSPQYNSQPCFCQHQYGARVHVESSEFSEGHLAVYRLVMHAIRFLRHSLR